MADKENYTNRFDQVYEKYYNKIFYYCLEELYHDFDSAHDACTDVFVAFNKNQNKINDKSIYSWLHSAAYKSIKNIKRKYARKYKHLTEVDIEDCNIPVELFDNVSLTPQYIEKVQLEIMEKLNDNEKLLFQYKYIEEKSLNEIAEILNIPYDTLYYRMMATTKLCKSILKEITDKSPY